MRAADLDLFILAVVHAGLGTPYDLKSKAGLSVGSTSPVLERLEKDGLIKAGQAGPRKSRRYSITKAGDKALESGWTGLLDTQSTDLDTILRTLYVTWTLGRREQATNFIDKSVKALTGAAAIRTAEANQLQAILGAQATGEAFRWLRTVTAAARLRAEAEALQQVSKQIASQKGKK